MIEIIISFYLWNGIFRINNKFKFRRSFNILGYSWIFLDILGYSSTLHKALHKAQGQTCSIVIHLMGLNTEYELSFLYQYIQNITATKTILTTQKMKLEITRLNKIF